MSLINGKRVSPSSGEIVLPLNSEGYFASAVILIKCEDYVILILSMKERYIIFNRSYNSNN